MSLKSLSAKVFSRQIGDVAVNAETIEILRRGDCAFVQFGANGVAEDPLQESAIHLGALCILIEPHPYYCGLLRQRYADRPNVRIVENAAATSSSMRALYFVPPDIANEMDGNGPPNKWAHGQGSFDRDHVEYWIRANEFRWHDPSRTQTYVDKITSIEVRCRPAAEIVLDHIPPNAPCVVVIDTQGAESIVLRSILSERGVNPKLIAYEDDRGFALSNFCLLLMKGYKCLQLGDNITFARTPLQCNSL